jgi:hypothetical protein
MHERNDLMCTVPHIARRVHCAFEASQSGAGASGGIGRLRTATYSIGSLLAPRTKSQRAHARTAAARAPFSPNASTFYDGDVRGRLATV